MRSSAPYTFKLLVIAGLTISAANFNQGLFAGGLVPGIVPCLQEEESEVDVEALIEEGQSMIQSGDLKSAAEAFRKVVAADEDQGLAWQLLGYSLHMDGKLDEAIEVHAKAASFDAFRGIGNYNLACVWSLKKDADKAIDYFTRAVEAGFDDMEIIDSDTDLDNIRSDSRFEPIVEWARTGKKPVQEENPFVGTWKVGMGQRAGEEVAAERLGTEIEFTDKQIMIPVPGAEEGFVMNYTLDTTKTPVTIDMEIESGPAPEGKAVGIIKVDDGKLTLCYDPTGAKRPEAFETTAENGFFLFECMKSPATDGFDPAVVQGEWVFVSGIKAGAESTKEALAGTVKIDGENITIPAGDDEFVMSYKIDTSKTPATIDMKILSGPAPEGSAAFGIIKQDGKNIVLCYNAFGEERPTSFESTTDNNLFLFTLKPAK